MESASFYNLARSTTLSLFTQDIGLTIITTLWTTYDRLTKHKLNKNTLTVSGEHPDYFWKWLNWHGDATASIPKLTVRLFASSDLNSMKCAHESIATDCEEIVKLRSGAIDDLWVITRDEEESCSLLWETLREHGSWEWKAWKSINDSQFVIVLFEEWIRRMM